MTLIALETDVIWRNLIIIERKDIEVKYYFYYFIINDEEIVVEMDFHHLARPRNMSVDLKYDVLCF